MPINVDRLLNNYYEFPFNQVISSVQINDALSLQTVQLWRNTCYRLDKYSLTELKNLTDIIHEHFSVPFRYYLNGQAIEYYYQFDIESINKRISSSNLEYMKTSTVLNSCKYDHTAIGISSNHPILIYPFPLVSKKLNSVIIDGNHSLCASIKRKDKYVSCYICKPQRNDFLFSIDYVMYLIHCFICGVITAESVTESMKYLDHFLKISDS